MSDSFWWLFGFDSIISLIILYFFFTGLSDGSISSFNAGIWTILMLIAVGVPSVSLLLRHFNYLSVAKTILWVMALPGILYGLFMLIIIITNPKWN